MTLDVNDSLKNLPQVEKVLQREEILPFLNSISPSGVKAVVRAEIDLWRGYIRNGKEFDEAGFIEGVCGGCKARSLEKIGRVINATGVVIHTNLGRSPLSGEILQRMAREMSGYCNLEIHLPDRGRGGRGGFAEDLVSDLAGAGDSLLVNNNAASVFLILSEFARGKEVIVSRGEAIQIGGGFRIPDIMAQSGASLVEVGTTNITTIDDYRNAVSGNTGMIFSAHRSNFRMEGFTESPSLSEMASLKNENIIFVRDLGSGNLFPAPELSSPIDPPVRQELAQGPDLLCFSGDKLLGACQAGIIAGRRDLVKRLRKNPLMRMLRMDKLSYYILQESLLAYSRGERHLLPLWNMLFQSQNVIDRRIRSFMRRVPSDIKACMKKMPTRATLGGGSMPGYEIPSSGIMVTLPGKSPDSIAEHLAAVDVPVVGVISNGAFVLDFFTILDQDIPDLLTGIKSLSGLQGN